MISELSKNDFHKCNALINFQGHIEVKAIVEGINPGRIFVDDVDFPKTGLVWLGNNDGFYLIGDEENDEFNCAINSYIDNVITPEAKKAGLKWFEGIGIHPRWDRVIERVFEHRKLGSWQQRVYLLEKDDYKGFNEPIIEEGYTVVKISKTLYENNEIHNIEFLHEKVLEFWSSPDIFFNIGTGYCMVHQNKIVSICFSGFVLGSVHCIDIETLKDHRGKKLAQKLAHQFVKECVERDFVPYWDCMDSNKPSKAVAENIGLTNVFNYIGYEFPFD